MSELCFDAMGSAIRLIADDPGALAQSQRWVHEFDARMSRFVPDSELCRLNSDPRQAVPASPLLRATVGAALWAAQRSNGLLDPTVIDDLERAGYTSSFAGRQAAPLADALRDAPARAGAQPSPEALWRLVKVDDERGIIRRPPGVRLDSGGAGKGLAADALAHRLRNQSRVVVDCGGDVRIAGAATRSDPFDVEIEHPLTGTTVHAFRLGDGAIATSGLATRIWRTAAGGYAHHLIDPATGRPAWTGLIQATAVAPTALEAETLAKMALLAGPETASDILAPYGGALIHDDGQLELVGALRLEEVAA